MLLIKFEQKLGVTNCTIAQLANQKQIDQISNYEVLSKNVLFNSIPHMK